MVGMDTSEFALHAWGDESMRSTGVEVPAYLLGAVVADPTACDDYRTQMLPLRGSGPKLHWRELDRLHRDRVVSVLAEFDTSMVVVVGTTLEMRKQERARALCLERLSWELSQQAVTQLTLEARPQSLMQKDRRTIAGLRSRIAIPASLRIDHGQPSTEPMLWIADQVLGAYGDALAGESRWFDRLQASMEIVPIEL